LFFDGAAGTLNFVFNTHESLICHYYKKDQTIDVDEAIKEIKEKRGNLTQ